MQPHVGAGLAQTARALDYSAALPATALARVERQARFLQRILHALSVDRQVLCVLNFFSLVIWRSALLSTAIYSIVIYFILYPIERPLSRCRPPPPSPRGAPGARATPRPSPPSPRRS
jgi:hypothetical protein